MLSHQTIFIFLYWQMATVTQSHDRFNSLQVGLLSNSTKEKTAVAHFGMITTTPLQLRVISTYIGVWFILTLTWSERTWSVILQSGLSVDIMSSCKIPKDTGSLISKQL